MAKQCAVLGLIEKRCGNLSLSLQMPQKIGRMPDHLKSEFSADHLDNFF
jgi:hypothetical protein